MPLLDEPVHRIELGDAPLLRKKVDLAPRVPVAAHLQSPWCVSRPLERLLHPVDGVASRVHGFRPKPLGRLELSKHCPRHVYKRLVLPLYHTILLWCVGSRELVLDPFLLKVLLHLKVLELGPVVAPYLLHLELKFILSSP